MKTLIDNIVAFLRAGISNGSITATKVYKGYESMPDQVAFEAFPYIAVDDGGERVEDIAAQTQKRYYSVTVEMGVLIYDPELSLDAILTLADEVKAVFELPANRQVDGHTWGIKIDPFMGDAGQEKLFRGRKVTIEFHQLEDRTGDY